LYCQAEVKVFQNSFVFGESQCAKLQKIRRKNAPKYSTERGHFGPLNPAPARVFAEDDHERCEDCAADRYAPGFKDRKHHLPGDNTVIRFLGREPGERRTGRHPFAAMLAFPRLGGDLSHAKWARLHNLNDNKLGAKRNPKFRTTR